MFSPALKTTAQVAVEAIVNENGTGYEFRTMQSVYEIAETVGVSSMYLDMLREVIVRADPNHGYMPSREGMPNFD